MANEAKADQRWSKDSRCRSWGDASENNYLCDLSFITLISETRYYDGALINVRGTLVKRFDYFLLVQYPPRLGLNDPLDSFEISGDETLLAGGLVETDVPEMPMDIISTIEKDGHAKVQIVGRLSAGPRVTQAFENAGAISIKIVRRIAD